jgi:hypothetical protein
MNWVAFGCTTGINLQGGAAVDIFHATSVNNSSNGIQSNAGSSGLIVNTISWGNANNLNLTGTHTISFSDGALGGSGNIDLDPEFVDQAGGDLNLQAGSPCIDMADFATAVAVEKDHDEFSRLLDPTLSGNLQADMGAYEHHRWRMHVSGQPHVGSTLILEVQGPAPGFVFFRLGLAPANQLQSPLGFRMIGSTPSQVGLGASTVNAPLLMRIPFALGLVGQEFGVQTLTISSAAPVRGEWTNLYRSCFLPKRPGKPLLLNIPPEISSGVVIQQL